MKPAPFTYLRPETVPEALQLLGEHGDSAKPIAGGQSLMPMLNLRLARLDYMVDILRLPGLDGVDAATDGGLTLGALVRHRDLTLSACVADRAPLLKRCAPLIGHPAIRNRGTLGGSIVHADPAAELPAALLALDACIHLTSIEGKRIVPVGEFFQGIFTTVTRPDELVVAVDIPPERPRTGWSFLEMTRRHGDFALVGVAAGITLDGSDRCVAARLVLAGAAGGPYRERAAEEMLEGDVISPERLSEVARRLVADVQMPGDIHASAKYRREAARVYAERALTQARQRAEEKEKA